MVSVILSAMADLVVIEILSAAELEVYKGQFVNVVRRLSPLTVGIVLWSSSVGDVI